LSMPKRVAAINVSHWRSAYDASYLRILHDTDAYDFRGQIGSPLNRCIAARATTWLDRGRDRGAKMPPIPLPGAKVGSGGLNG
jgi:hypothetical protein